MALRLIDPTAIINRVSNLVPASSDYSCCVEYQYTTQAAAPNYECPFVMTNLAYSAWAGVFGNDGGVGPPNDFYVLDVRAGAGVVSAPAQLPPATPRHFFYIRSGTSHLYLVNNVLIDTETLDVSGQTWAELLLGNDRFTVTDNIRLQRFREWNLALSLGQAQQEMGSGFAVNRAGLWCDCPLTSDLLDVSGNGRHLSGVGNFDFVAALSTARRFYFNIAQDTYTPPTIRGGWDQTPGANNAQLLHPQKVGQTNTQGTINGSAVASGGKIALYRGVSPPLAAGTLAGTVQLGINAWQRLDAFNNFTKLYGYITVGDTDAVRGVAFDIEESSGAGDTEWPFTNFTPPGPATPAIDLTAPVALTPVVHQAGDRLVVIFGAISPFVTSNLRLRTGGRLNTTAFDPQPDAIPGNTANGVPWVELSAGLTLQDESPQNLSADSAVPITLPLDQTLDPGGDNVSRFWIFTPALDFVLSWLVCNAGRTAVGELWTEDLGLREDNFEQKVKVWPVLGGGPRVMITGRIEGYTPGDTLSVTLRQGPLDAVQPGDLLILPDDAAQDNLYDPTKRGFNPEAFFNPSTGAVRHTSAKFLSAELGASFLDGRWAATQGVSSLSPLENTLFVYGAAPGLAETARAVLPAPINSLGSNLVDRFYVSLQDPANLTHFPVHLVNGAGVASGPFWFIPRQEGGTFFTLGGNWDGHSSMGISRDNAVAYYNMFRGTAGPPLLGIGRHDLLTDSVLPSWPLNLTFPNLQPQDIIVLSDNSVLAVWTTRPFVGATSSWNSVLVHYAPDGSIILQKAYPGLFLHHIVHATDDDPAVAWVWLLLSAAQVADGSEAGIHRLELTDLATGDVRQSFESYVFLNRLGPFDPAGTCNPQRFGAEDSCPLIMMMGGSAPPPPEPGTGCPVAFATDPGGTGACRVSMGVT